MLGSQHHGMPLQAMMVHILPHTTPHTMPEPKNSPPCCGMQIHMCLDKHGEPKVRRLRFRQEPGLQLYEAECQYRHLGADEEQQCLVHIRLARPDFAIFKESYSLAAHKQGGCQQVQGLHSFEPIECSPGLRFPVPFPPMLLQLQIPKSKMHKLSAHSSAQLMTQQLHRCILHAAEHTHVCQ